LEIWLERGFVLSVRACLALVLLTPLVRMPEVLHAFTVGLAAALVVLGSLARSGQLATPPRILLYTNIAPNWDIMHGPDPAKGFRLLTRAEAEQREALSAEPRNRRLLHSLAATYTAVAKTGREDALRARYRYDRSGAVAPFQAPLVRGMPGGRGKP